jgi:hypothetical protein
MKHILNFKKNINRFIFIILVLIINNKNNMLMNRFFGRAFFCANKNISTKAPKAPKLLSG